MFRVPRMNGEDTHFIWYDEISSMNWAAWSKLLYRGRKFQVDNMNSSVEDLIQQTKDQNGRVYQTLKNQESRIKGFEAEVKRLEEWQKNHKCPSVPYNYGYTATIELFQIIESRIGVKGILKMLAER